MKVYIGILAVSTALTMGTFFYHDFLHRWYDILLVLPIWLVWFLAATALYFLLLYLISLTVDPSKTVRKKELFFRWLLNQTVWLILHLGRVEIQSTGLEKLEGLPPFLMVANHRSNFDPFIAIAACPQVDLAYIAKPEIFNIPIVGRIYKTTGDFIQGLGTPTVNSTGGEWMVIGLARSGRTVPAGYYDNVVEYVKAKADANERLHRAKVTDNARVILALTAIGKDVTNVGGHNLLKGLDNMAYVQKQGINGPIFTLIALDSHNYPTMGDVTREKLIQVILDAQLPDGGWNLSGENADPDMTAMAIQALAPYYKTNETVKAAVDKALEALSALQRTDGGFGSWGTVNSESCAQVIVALTALGIDPIADSRFVKNSLTVLDALAGFYVTGGGFRHTAGGDLDGMATEQGYYALAAYYRFVNAQTRLYDMTDVTIQTGGSNTPATGNTGVLVWIIALPVTILAAAFVLKRKEREA